MVATASIVNKYDRADAAGKVDIICKNYSNFMGIVDSYTEGLCYMIAEEEGIQYESAAQRVRRIKLKVKVQMVGFLEGNA